jgi:glycosyltransferase involved in cell wall biosynthesis
VSMHELDVASARSTRALRIEMVLPSLFPAGQEMMVARLTRGLAGMGHDVGITVTMEEGSLAQTLRTAGHDVTLVPAPGLKTNWRAEGLIARFRSRRPDVVHVHSGVWLKAARAARAAGIPRVIHTVHGLLDQEPWYGDTLKRLAARATDVVVAVSEPLRRFLVDGVHLDPRRVVTLPNGVDTVQFRPGADARALRKRLGFRPDGPVIGHVARLAPIKNQTLLLDAFATLIRRVPDAALVIVGDGPERPVIEGHIRQLAIEHAVRLVGEVEDAAPFYRGFDVFVLCSNAEGTSMSVLEALASGVCVVATQVGGNPALLRDGGCGVLIPPADAPALLGALESVLSDSTRRQALGAAGRLHVEANYSEQRMLDRYVELYRGDSTRLADHTEAEACAG